jgi:Ca-activated chloride channel family protein
MLPSLRNALLCVLFLLSPPALADDGFGAIMGYVLDAQSHETLADVVVTATSPNLMGEQTVVTDGYGFYWIPQLPPGIYTLRIEAGQFKPCTRQIVVRLNQTYRMNIVMSPESLGEVVEMVGGSASAPWGNIPARSTRGSSGSGSSSSYSYTPPPPPSPFQPSAMSGEFGSGRTVSQPSTSFSDRDFLEMYFQGYGVNPTVETTNERFSTFSMEVDTASYALSRGYLDRGVLPDERAVRVEEFVNTFDYGYVNDSDAPFSIHVEGFPSLHRPGYHVLHVGLKAREVPAAQRKPSHLVFTIDISGSMADANKLPIVKKGLRMLVDALDERDRVSIVVYGSTARQVLGPTNVLRRDVLLAAIDGLQVDGATNVQAGLDLAYTVAAANMVEGGVNRVILCSDGVANNGITTDADGIWARVKGHTERGITLSTVGFGMGHYNDVLMERLSHVGEGNYAYVDRLEEAHRIFVQNLTGTLQVVAKDAKVQLEFDPSVIARYRLVGYENRILARHQFADDTVDAGEVGSGHTVTAIYEVKAHGELAGNFATLRLRYKAPEGGSSREVIKSLPARVLRPSFASATPPTRLSYVAAAFAEKLRASYWMRPLAWEQLVALHAQVGSPLAERTEVVELGNLIRKAASLDQRTDRFEAIAPVRLMDSDQVPRI